MSPRADGLRTLHELPAEIQQKVAEQYGGVQLGPNSPLRSVPVAQRPASIGAPVKKGSRTNKRELEWIQQRQVIAWRDEPRNLALWPELRWLSHWPNGGGRSKRDAGMLRAAGVVSGPPDLWLPVRRLGYVGCTIEMKHASSNLAAQAQLEWNYHLAEQGWFSHICLTGDAAIAKLTTYLNLPRDPECSPR